MAEPSREDVERAYRHEDEVILDENRCSACDGWGFLPAIRALKRESGKP